MYKRQGLGTWCNLAPEQARGDALGPAADVWGLGTVLYEAVAGEPAFDEDDGSWTDDGGPSGTWDSEDQAAAGYPQLDRAAAPCQGPLAGAIEACLAPEPGDRPSLDELAEMQAPHAPGARPWGP